MLIKIIARIIEILKPIIRIIFASKFSIYGILFFNLIIAFGIIFSDKNVAGVESNVVYSVQSMLAGNDLYSNPNTPPFSITQYMPLPYLIYKGVAETINLKPGIDAYKIIITLRSISFFFNVLLLVGVFYILRKIINLETKISLLLVSIIFVVPVPWYYVARPDIFLSAFLIISVTFYFKSLKDNKSSINKVVYPILTGVFLFFTFFCKQNGLVNLFLIIIFSLLINKKKLIPSVLFGFIIGGLSCYLMTWNMDYTFFKENIIDGVSNGINIHLAIRNAIIPFIAKMLSFTIIAMLIFAYSYKKILSKSNETGLFLFYFFLSHLLIGLIASLKEGSSTNYFFDATIFAIIFIGYWISSVKISLHPNYLSLFLIVVVFNYCIGYSFYYFFEYSKSGYEIIANQRISVYKENRDIIHFLNDEISKDSSIFYFTNHKVLENSVPFKCIFPQEEIVDALYPTGSGFFYSKIFDYSTLNDIYESGALKYAVFKDDKYIESGFASLNFSEDFLYFREIDGYTILVNKRSAR